MPEEFTARVLDGHGPGKPPIDWTMQTNKRGTQR